MMSEANYRDTLTQTEDNCRQKKTIFNELKLG